jgi:two-component system CitB family sensor kinase
VLQGLLLSLLVLIGVVAVFADTQRDTQETAREQVLTLARSLAVSPQLLTAAQSGDAEQIAELQPYAEAVRARTGVDFVVFMAPDRTRWSHPNPGLLGKPFIGTIDPALAGRAFTETATGTLGPSVRAVAPVQDADGRVIGLVAIGISTEVIGRALTREVPTLALLAALALAIALAGAVLVSRRLRRQTHGMGAEEITRMYEYYEAVLHAVREGLVLLDRRGQVLLVNDEARRLLELPENVTGRPVTALALPPSLAEVLGSGRAATDELHLTGERVLVVSQSAALWEGRHLGTVTTMRDHTELQDLAGELNSVRPLTEALRSQAHEAANRMHTVVSLLELGRAADAVAFATAELEVAQRLTDQVVASVGEPVLSATLLGKAAAASERGVELVITEDTAVREDLHLSPRDLVTVVGNLLDNAIDAASDAPPPAQVVVTVREADGELVVRVADTGRGLEPERLRDAFRRGWSTKPATAAHGRGLGLALVGQVVNRLGGRIDVDRGVGAIFTVRLPLPLPMPVRVPSADPLPGDRGGSDGTDAAVPR